MKIWYTARKGGYIPQKNSLFDENGKMTGKPLEHYREERDALNDELPVELEEYLERIRSAENITAEDLNTIIGPCPIMESEAGVPQKKELNATEELIKEIRSGRKGFWRQ